MNEAIKQANEQANTIIRWHTIVIAGLLVASGLEYVSLVVPVRRTNDDLDLLRVVTQWVCDRLEGRRARL